MSMITILLALSFLWNVFHDANEFRLMAGFLATVISFRIDDVIDAIKSERKP